MVFITRLKYHGGAWVKFRNLPRVYFGSYDVAIAFVDFNWALFVVPPPEPLS